MSRNSLNNYSNSTDITTTLLAPASQHLEAIADSGCTGHFLQENSHCLDKKGTTSGITVLLPNKARMKATNTCTLDLPSLPLDARQGHTFPALAKSLISIGVLCDANCVATFSKWKLVISRNNEVLMQGNCDSPTGLWTLPLKETHASANSAYQTTTQADHVQFLHACAGYPVPSTWIDAINRGQYTTWPGLTSNLVMKHLPKSDATIKGHLHAQCKNLCSTRKLPSDKNEPPTTPMDPITTPGERSHHVFTATIDIRN